MKNFVKVTPLFIMMLMLSACGDDTDPTGTNNEKTGTMEFRLTDAPIDNSNIKSCVITISELRVDGQAVEGFNRTQVDILAYQEGRIFNAGDYELEAGSYSELELVLSDDMTSSGKPGCYIEEQDGTVHALNSSDLEVALKRNFNVQENSRTEMLVDFDLRKAIRSDNTSSGDGYQFVSESELSSALRLTQSDNGTIEGNCNDMVTGSDRIVVFAYKKGEFDRNKEIEADATTGLRFENAVNSAMCDQNGDFSLHFLEDGEYELHFMGYEQEADGSLSLKGSLQLDLVGALLSPLSVELNGGQTVNLNVEVTGLIGI